MGALRSSLRKNVAAAQWIASSNAVLPIPCAMRLGADLRGMFGAACASTTNFSLLQKRDSFPPLCVINHGETVAAGSLRFL
jgi:hypothetical protein